MSDSDDLFERADEVVTRAARNPDFPDKHQKIVTRAGYVLAEELDEEERETFQEILSELAEV